MKRTAVFILLLFALLVMLLSSAQAAQKDWFIPGVWEGCFSVGGIDGGFYQFRITISEKGPEEDTEEDTGEYRFLLEVAKNDKTISVEMIPCYPDHWHYDDFNVRLSWDQYKEFGFLWEECMFPHFFGESKDCWLTLKFDTLGYKDGIECLCLPEGFLDRSPAAAEEGFEDDFSISHKVEEKDHLTPVFCTENQAFIQEAWFNYAVSSFMKPFLIHFHFEKEAHSPDVIDRYAEHMYLLLDDNTIVSYRDILFPKTKEGRRADTQDFELAFMLDNERTVKALLANGKSFDLSGLPETGEKLNQVITPEEYLDRLYYLSGNGKNYYLAEKEVMSGDPYIQGKMLIGVYRTEDDSDYSTEIKYGETLYGLEEHPDLLAETVEEAGTFVLITQEFEQAGQYDNGGIASKTTTYMYIFNKELDGSWRRMFVTSDNPPKSGYVFGSRDGLAGEFNPEEAVRMLLEMEYRP